MPTTTVAKPPTTTPPPAGKGPSVSANRTSGLNPAGDSITLNGRGFSTSGTGIYIGVAQMNRYSTTDASVFQDAKFIKPTEMPGGSWSAKLDVSAAFPGSDCLANACAVYTLAAHGSSDRSQDTVTRIAFAGGAAGTDTPVGPGVGNPGNPGNPGSPAGPGAPGTPDAPGTPAGAGGGGGGVSTVTSNGNLSVSLSKSSNLNPGETVTISGSGFSGAAPGLYVGMVQDDRFSATDASAWMTTAFLKPDAIAGGSWSVSMELPAVVGDFDCLKNTCSIYTVAAHGSSDRSQDSRTPVGFAGGVAPDTSGGVGAGPGAAGAGGAGGAASAAVKGEVGKGNSVVVTLSKSSGLKVDGDTITVSGTGFSSSGPGIYAGLIQDDKFTTTDAGAWMTTAFITPNKIVDGAWSTTMDVMAVKGDSDCTKNACSVYTIAAHGSSDRSQDSQTPVTFGDGAGGETSEAQALAAEGGSGSGGSKSGSAGIRNLSSSFTEGSGWVLPLLLGGGIGAGIAVATTVAMRRRS
ncbi:hypothetical protein [Rhodococcus kronopolitis]|uniref:IPT/TIG domain-containing protein n=1 Tax=Rhodococcus kronopolitis TaxID=1460226 RepID=A0ABV9FLR2_9NOCA